MGSPAVFELEALLQPFDSQQRGGMNLREDRSPTSPYGRIKGARDAARTIERNALGGVDQPKADWKPVLNAAPDILKSLSKDMEITCWYIEALVREHKFAGLRDGFKLAHELVVRFWNDLHPLPDPEDGLARRLAPLTGLNGEGGAGTLITPINSVPLTMGKGIGPFACWVYRQAEEIEAITDPDRRRARMERGATSLDTYLKAVADTPAPFFANLVDDLKDCVSAFEQLCAALTEKCGVDANGQSISPPSSRIRETLEGCLEVVMTTAKSKLDSLVPAATAEGSAESSMDSSSPPADSAAGGGGGRSGRIASREQAFEEILRIAHFFRERDPHSPMAFALEQVVRWGRLPLPELLTELLPEESPRQSLFRLVGIPPPKPDEPSSG